MRIVGGRFRGRTLATPQSNAIRPTSDRLREAVFNVLIHGYGDPITDARVLDLFAGTGALGLEAMSRGAAFATFVDDGAEARGILRTNIETFGLGGTTRIFRRDATAMGDVAPNEPFSLVFCDPPYNKGLGLKALSSCVAGGWLSPEALVVAEDALGEEALLPDGFELIEERHYGETRFAFGRLKGNIP